MRPTHSFIAAALVVTALAGCGTKTSLTLPPQIQTRPVATGTVPPAGTPAIDNSNKAAEPAK